MNEHSLKKYHLGCTGWSMREWKGSFYSENARPSDFLKQYATVFNSVEGNTAFYNIPKKETVQRWGKSLPEGFKFCFKFHRSVTHKKLLKDARDDILSFLDHFESISTNLGPFMLQLPPKFSFEHIGDLEKTLAVLPAAFSYAVEVRNLDFFDQGQKEKRFNRLLESYNVDRIIFDTRKLHDLQSNDETIKQAQQKKPKLPIRFTATGSRPLVRYVGSNDVLNNEIYLKEWAIVVADWIKEGKKPYIFTHAPDSVRQPPIARKFHQMLSQFIDTGSLPASPAEKSSKQRELF